MRLILVPALLLLGLGVACDWLRSNKDTPIEPRADLDSSLPYLEALRKKVEAEDPAMKDQFARDRAEYAEFKKARIAEMRTHPYYDLYPEWGEDEWIGWDTWFNWTGGNAFMWRDMTQRSKGQLNLLKLLDNNLIDRAERFSRFGLINNPAASGPDRDADGNCGVDEYGLCLDKIEDWGESQETLRFMGSNAGVMGMRMFPNPDFDPAVWDAEDPWGQEGFVQPPYLVGLSCGFCHISFHPEYPPEDSTNPKWENLAGALGNIYLQEGPLFSWVLNYGADAFNTHYLEAQPAGTSDTSRIATDDIDNPNAINAIFNLPARLDEAESEQMPNGHYEKVPHILKDGADSVGVPLASVRVYVNIGLLGNYWLRQHDAYLILGGEPRPQQPFRITEAMRTPSYDGSYSWNQTEVRMADAKTFLATLRPYKLSRAPGGDSYLTAAPTQLERGKLAFADHCARCHSSKQPDIDREADPEGWKEAMRALVLRDDFLDGNFLSDDRRHPVTEVGVNMARSMATNATQGHIWEDFSSLTYKNQPSVGSLELPHFQADGKAIQFEAPAGGRGYYRTASLISIWSTAPFFHNNSVGRHVPLPDVESRMTAFEDAAEQLLWPERRTDPEGRVGPYIKRTGDEVTWLELPNTLWVPVPAKTPIKLVGNLPLHGLAEKLPAEISRALNQEPSATKKQIKEKILADVIQSERLRPLLIKSLLDLNTSPDFVENKGHETLVAAIPSDEEKRALIEFMKTF